MWIGAIFAYAFGDMDTPFIVLLICIITDYITGLIHAIYTKRINSQIGFKGVLKKCAILFMVVVANMGDKLLDMPVIRNTVIFFYIANEAISIFENMGKLGIPIPKKIKNVFEQLKEDNNGDGKNSK